jgi:biuret amidohydrolase
MSSAAKFFDVQSSPVPPVTVDPGDTALVIVDMQYYDAHPAGVFNVAMDRIEPGSMDYFNERTESLTVPSIGRLLRFSREAGLQVVHLVLGAQDRGYADLSPRLREWIRSVERRSGVADIFWAGHPDFRIRSELEPVDGEAVVRKTTFGAFNGSDIDDQLRRRGIRNLVLTGISTNCCVESTTRDAAERGYGCVVVDDATADYEPEAHVASLRALSFNHARVVRTVDDVVRAGEDGRPV